MTDEWVKTISHRYIELYEKVTGKKFEPVDLEDDDIYRKTASTLEEWLHSTAG
jgi:phosphoribosylaminoimidazole-succinocarboxamide synthase